jgi:hypothetical protein
VAVPGRFDQGLCRLPGYAETYRLRSNLTCEQTGRTGAYPCPCGSSIAQPSAIAGGCGSSLAERLRRQFAGSFCQDTHGRARDGFYYNFIRITHRAKQVLIVLTVLPFVSMRLIKTNCTSPRFATDTIWLLRKEKHDIRNDKK